jgi:hypothetical protein
MVSLLRCCESLISFLEDHRLFLSAGLPNEGPVLVPLLLLVTSLCYLQDLDRLIGLALHLLSNLPQTLKADLLQHLACDDSISDHLGLISWRKRAPEIIKGLENAECLLVIFYSSLAFRVDEFLAREVAVAADRVTVLSRKQ